jgi:IS5 family transposase
MIADFDDFCTWMYVLISDLFAPLASLMARPGPEPACTDAELITMAIVGECCGWDEETVLLSQWQAHRDLFPLQPDRTRFNRRRRALTQAINLVRHAVLQTLDLAQDTGCIIDSLPIPVVQFYSVPQANADWKAAGATFGHCCSKKQAIFGYKLHLLLTQSGVIRDFVLAPANAPDLTVGVTLLEGHSTLQVLADKGYISHAVAESLRARGGLDLLTIPRTNQRRQPSAAFRHLHAHLRQLIETVNSQLALQFHIETNHAHSFWGLTARLATKLAAHTLCVWLNRLLGAPKVLHIKQLAFPNN